MVRTVLLAVLAVVAFLATASHCHPRPAPGVTPEQYEKSLKMLRNVCVPKSGIPEDTLQRMIDGEFVEDQKAFCYLACCLQTTMVLKNNKVDSKMFKAQVKKMLLPDDAARAVAAFTSCEGTPPGPEPCETTGTFLRCVHKADPTFKIPA